MKRASPLLESAIFSLSLATLCFLPLWDILIRLASDGSVKYFETAPPPVAPVISLVFDVIVLAGVILLLLTIRDRVPLLKGPSQFALAILALITLYRCEHLVLLLGLKTIATYAHPVSPIHTGWEIAVVCCLLLTALWSRRFLAIAKRLVFVLSPLFFVLVANSAWFYSRPDPALLGNHTLAGKLSGRTSTASKRKVVWIIFDEMDYYLAFEGRPRRLKMPEFDRLRGESLFGEHVSAPARYTLLSMPSFITGRKVVDVKIKTSDLNLRFESSRDWVSFASTPNLFRTARNTGFNTAMAGWYHSYCRVLGNDLSACASVSNNPEELGIVRGVAPWPFWKRSLFLILWNTSYLPVHTIRDLLTPHSITGETSPGVQPHFMSVGILPQWIRETLGMKGWIRREEHIRSVKLITANALRMLKDADLNLVMIHLPAPHPEGIWNSDGQRLSADEPSDYLDNLELADHLLGLIRSTLEASGDWDRTAIVISADHPFRTTTWRAMPSWNSEMESLTRGKDLRYVPFLLKLAGRHAPTEIERPFDNVVSADLILKILNGEIVKPEQAISFLGK